MMSEQSCTITPGQPRPEEVSLHPENRVAEYREAIALAKAEAEKRLGEYMLISWYDRDRDYESPPNTTECAGVCEKNGYVQYALSHGATLRVDIEEGRFVFYFTPVEW
ncbi:MAG: AF1514 family protein [Desulfobulbaceae bacterium]